jgi:hypothetical protein
MVTAQTSYTTSDTDLCFIYDYDPCTLSTTSDIVARNADGTRYDLGNITQGLPITSGCSHNWIWIDLSPYLGSSNGLFQIALFSGDSDFVREWQFGWKKGEVGATDGSDSTWCCDDATDCVDDAPSQGNRVSGDPDSTNSGCYNTGSCHDTGSSASPNEYCDDGTWRDNDYSQTACETCFGAGKWNLGGDINTCCGDDANEYEKTRTSGEDATWSSSSSDDACCDNNSDCVESSECTVNGFAKGTIPSRNYCFGGVWYGGDYSQAACNAVKGTKHWNIGGEINATVCCGDDSGEYKRNKTCAIGSGCSSDSDDDACCDNLTDCVNGSICYSEGSAHPDLKEVTCVSGSWKDTSAPSEPIPLEPRNDIYSSNSKPNLNWSNVSETNFANYTLEVSDSSIFAHINYTYNTFNINETNYTVSEVLTDGVWYWRVIAYDLSGNFNVSRIFTYIVDTVAPVIMWNKPLYDNSTLVAKWFKQNITVSDLNLYWLNCTIYNSTGGVYWSKEWNLTGFTSYTVTDIVDISNWPLGLYYENCTVWDLTGRDLF